MLIPSGDFCLAHLTIIKKWADRLQTGVNRLAPNLPRKLSFQPVRAAQQVNKAAARSGRWRRQAGLLLASASVAKPSYSPSLIAQPLASPSTQERSQNPQQQLQKLERNILVSRLKLRQPVRAQTWVAISAHNLRRPLRQELSASEASLEHLPIFHPLNPALLRRRTLIQN